MKWKQISVECRVVKQHIILLGLVIGLAGFNIPAAAQRGKGSTGGSSPMSIPHNGANAGSKYADFLYGVIKQLDKDEMVLTKTKSGADQTFKFYKKTKFIHDGKDSTIESLHLGDEVWVDADEDKKTGELIAHKVVTGIFSM